MNRAFRALGLPFVYLAFDVSPAELGTAVRGMRALGFRGWNVTIPHKVAVLEHLDEVEETAREIGAVNTVVAREGRLVGYNTDGEGYLRSLVDETGLDLVEQKVLILGAGGAARAVAHALAGAGVESITIANRTREKAERLAASLRKGGCAGRVAVGGGAGDRGDDAFGADHLRGHVSGDGGDSD